MPVHSTEHFDPRVTPARPDLAASYLKGKVQATSFVDGELREICDSVAPLRREPSHEASLLTEALFGERVTVFEDDEEGWCWCQLESDKYVGWTPANALKPPGAAPSHKVTVLRTLMFPGPSIKMPPLTGLPLGAKLTITGSKDRFLMTESGGYVPACHLVPISAKERDFVSVAERFVGTPYLWGGKTSLGIDCSGLSQVALMASGIHCPRDSDMQEKALGIPVEPNASFSNLRRGDLVFWKGHVAMMHDATHIVHANAFHMAVTVEPLDEAITRIRESDGLPTSVRRISD